MFARPSVAAVQVGILTALVDPPLSQRVSVGTLTSKRSPVHVPVMTSRTYTLGNVAPGNAACRGILTRLLKAVRDARSSVCVRLPSADCFIVASAPSGGTSGAHEGDYRAAAPPSQAPPPETPRRDKRDLYLNLLQVPQLLFARLGVDPSRTCQDLCLVSGLVLPQTN